MGNGATTSLILGVDAQKDGLHEPKTPRTLKNLGRGRGSMPACICKVCRHKAYESCSKCTCCTYQRAACMEKL